MKTFIYTSSSEWSLGGTVRRVEVFRVRRNKPYLIARNEGTYKTTEQLVWEVLRDSGELPASAFERNPNGSPKYLPHLMKDAGIADVIAV